MGYLLGYDAGSSLIKAALLDADTGATVAAASSPPGELAIDAPRPGWAEQDPRAWWEHLQRATAMLGEAPGANLRAVEAIGISYQMHGLVVVDRELRPLRPAIIWCDSRAVEIGDSALRAIGEGACLGKLLNSPGNFTASRIKWVKESEPDVYRRACKVLLPGDYLAARMTGEAVTTPGGLSEMILWDFAEERAAGLVLEHFGIDPGLLPEVRPTFSRQGGLTRAAAEELGVRPGIPVSYRAGDQSNNAFSLRVLQPGEVAATAGTSGVMYGVTSRREGDPLSRVNVFLHVNHRAGDPRYGVLMCVNGAGILNRWLKGLLAGPRRSPGYAEMNGLAATAPPGSSGLLMLPYGNGAERTLGNRDVGASLHGLNFNLHTRAHLLRAAQEGVAFALNYGLEIMRGMGMEADKARAGEANMFLSPLFREIFAAVTGATLEIYDTDGAQGAARGAGIGAGLYRDVEEAFSGLRLVGATEPAGDLVQIYGETYARWRERLSAAVSDPCAGPGQMR